MPWRASPSVEVSRGTPARGCFVGFSRIPPTLFFMNTIKRHNRRLALSPLVISVMLRCVNLWRCSMARALLFVLDYISYFAFRGLSMCYETRGLIMSVQGGVAAIGETDIFVGRRSARGVVSEFSSSSRRRLLRFCAASLARYTVLLTVTLPHIEMDGRVFKRRLDSMLKWLKIEAEKSFAGQTWSALWVLEFQKRGAVHAHLLLTHPINKTRVRSRWVELWKSQIMRLFPDEAELMLEKMGKASTFVEKIRNRGDSLSYCAKYASKMTSKSVLSGGSEFGRWWGVRGERGKMSRDVREAWPLPRDPDERNRLLDGFWARINELASMAGVVRAFRWIRGLGFVFYQAGDDESWSGFLSRLRSVASSYGLVPSSDEGRERRSLAGLVYA